MKKIVLLPLILFLPFLAFSQECLEGNCNNGEGKAQYQYSSGETVIYEGSFKDSKRHGLGKMYIDGDLYYEGDFVNGQRTGKGKMYKDGELSYEGDFVNGSPSGKGKEYKSRPGEVYYEGDFINGKRNGKGVVKVEDSLLNENGITYTNVWVDGNTGMNNKENITGTKESSTIQMINNFGRQNLIPLSIGGMSENFIHDSGFTGELMISVSMALQLKKQNKISKYFPPVKIETANGFVFRDRVMVNSIKLGDYVLIDMVVIVTEQDHFLLGKGLTNLFDDVVISQKKNTITFFR